MTGPTTISRWGAALALGASLVAACATATPREGVEPTPEASATAGTLAAGGPSLRLPGATAASGDARSRCGEVADALRASLNEANSCESDADCRRITVPCVAPCGMAASEAALNIAAAELTAVWERCATGCGEVDCEPWTQSSETCHQGRCMLHGQSQVAARAAPEGADSAKPALGKRTVPPTRTPRPPGAPAEVFPILASICPVAKVSSSSLDRWGCRGCAPFGEPPDGKVVADPDAALLYRGLMVRGSFTKKGALQALVDFDSCKTEGSYRGGGVALVEKATTGWHWTLVSFHDDDALEQRCWPVPTTTHDVLACLSGARGPFGGHEGVFISDYSGGTRVLSRLADVHVQVLSTCWDVEPEGKLTHFEGSQLPPADRNGDGRIDLRVKAEWVHEDATSATVSRFHEQCAKRKEPKATRWVRPRDYLRLHTTELVFLQQEDGSFTPSEATAKWIADMPKAP